MQGPCQRGGHGGIHHLSRQPPNSIIDTQPRANTNNPYTPGSWNYVTLDSLTQSQKHLPPGSLPPPPFIDELPGDSGQLRRPRLDRRDQCTNYRQGSTMERQRNTARGQFDAPALMDDGDGGDGQPGGEDMSRLRVKSPKAKTRSLSDGGGTPVKLSPSPYIIEASRRTSKDDSNLRDLLPPPPVTPRRPDLTARRLSLQMPARGITPPPATSSAYINAAPLSPKLDHSQIYASPTNILPRRSRGLDFSRAATSLHHSILAEQSSPDSSPTIGSGRAMNIPDPDSRLEYGGLEQTSTSLWSMMGNQERMHISTSLGSAMAVGSDSSSSSDDDDIMDEDMEDAFVTTPQVSKVAPSRQMGLPGPFGSPAMTSLASFQQRQRPRKQAKKKWRGPLANGFTTAGSTSKSPPSVTPARRESISWQANQLRISGVDMDDSARGLSDAETTNGEAQRQVVRRVVSRRGNLLPKTKGFARIRAALLEEGAPAEAECLREAEVVKQVRESDVDLEPRVPSNADVPAPGTSLSSPNLNKDNDSLDDIPEDDMMGDLTMGLSGSFKQQVMKNSKGKSFWDTFSETSSIGGARTTPPPPAFLPRGSSSGVSEDIAMDSPSVGGGPSGFAVGASSHAHPESQYPHMLQTQSSNGSIPPTAAEITRRINSKRRRDDDYFDPISFKRRAVSPGLSVHNSPVPQSPHQRDSAQWGSRPGSNGGEKAGSSAPSDSGSMSGTPGNPSQGAGRGNGKGRVGFQGMVDTNDGLMRMSIE
ncbi:hypothetical protein S40293_03107 [Stachybotrys chartarum IBT 40293]|nr:hypothetical protein S40293_03107 [Stachybotrys chartarum IBT 40293]